MKDKLQHPGYVSFGLLMASLLVAASEWGSLAELENWGQLLSPTTLFSFLKSLGPVLVVWFSRTPLKT
jgi:hypothetical protein